MMEPIVTITIGFVAQQWKTQKQFCPSCLSGSRTSSEAFGRLHEQQAPAHSTAADVTRLPAGVP